MNSQYQLCFYSGSLTGKIFPITKEETKIGRDASCDIILTENSVSRIHVFLYVQQNGSVVLVDNNSTNGTVVNNYQISAPVQLSENDIIGLGGDVMFVFQKVAGFDPGSQWNGTDIPAGNAPDSYNFEKKQGIPMNDNNNFPNDGAVSGFGSSSQSQQPADNFGFNQAYSMNNISNPGYSQGQSPYGYGQNTAFGQYDPNGFGTPAVNPAADNGMQGIPAANAASGAPSADAVPAEAKPEQPVSQGNSFSQQQFQSPYGQMGQQMPYGGNSYSQQPMMGQQMPYGANPYGQMGQQQMGQQMPYGNDPYGQMNQQMMGQQMPYGNDPYSQQIGQQMPYGANPYGQQMGQQMPYGSDPYAQQMGQQMPYGNDPYGQMNQPMGQQMPYGNDPYGQQMNQPMGYGNNMQQMPYGQNPYGQQQMPYGNNPYGQQQFAGNDAPQNDEEEKKGGKKKLIITLIIILVVLLLIGGFIFYVDHNRLWCDFFPFLWDADTCANYMR